VSGVALATFVVVFAVACASPGPAVAAVLARVMAKGTAGMAAFCAGLLLGDLVWLSCAVFGLAALAALFQPIFLVLKYLGAAYLLYLAWRLWHAGSALPAAQPVRGQGVQLVAAGLLLAMGNPKTMLFYLAILPTVVDLNTLSVGGFLQLAAIVTIVFTIVFGGYVLLAANVRRIFTTPRSVRMVNRGAGIAMAGAAVAVAARQ
jgi:threonine/homoserine/homoserine lactone efflux protein